VGLTAEGLRPFLLDDEHTPPGIGRLGCGHQPGEPGPDYDDVGVHVHPLSLAATVSSHAAQLRPS